MLSRKADQFTLASTDTGHGQLLSVAINMNMDGFNSDSHTDTYMYKQ